MHKFNCTNVITIIEDMVNQLPYFQEVIKTSFTPNNNRCLIITGENATGKSFIRRIITQICKQEKIELIHLSQESRRVGGIISAFVYGDDSVDSTGYNSCNTVVGGITTCNGRDNDHFILWDEPDIGLSDRYAAGIGVTIKQFIDNIPKHTLGSIIITHSKHLVRQLLPINPSHLRVGDTSSLIDWLNETVEPSDIKELKGRNSEMFHNLNKIIKLKA